MISNVELAKIADILPATITRVENGMPYRMETQRRIVMALGYKISDKNKVFGDYMESFINDNGGRRLVVDRPKFKCANYS